MKKPKIIKYYISILLLLIGFFLSAQATVFAEDCNNIEGTAWLNSQFYSGPGTIKTPSGDIYMTFSSGDFLTFLPSPTDSNDILICIPNSDPCVSMGDSCRNDYIYFTSVSPTSVPTSIPASGGSTADDGGGGSGASFASDLDVFCDGDKGIETALGCIRWGESGFDGLVGFLLKNLMGLVGSVALIMIVYGSFLVMTSSGSPEKIAQGKEIITAAISGLLFAILSIFILRLIGVTWLQLPGLN
jgi:hypothetical protein